MRREGYAARRLPLPLLSSDGDGSHRRAHCTGVVRVSQQHLFDRILHAMHAAMLDDAHWPRCSALIDEACRTKGNILAFASGQSRDNVEIHFTSLNYRGERHRALEREYFDVYYAIDERIPRLMRLPDSDVVHITCLYTEDELKSSAAFNENLPLAQFCNGVNVRMDGPNGSRITWCTSDPVDADGWTFDRIESIRELLPHLRQYVTVRQALADARAFAATAMGLLENDGVGVIHLDRRGRVTVANDVARALLDGRDGLRYEDDRLRAALPDEDARLQKMLAEALPSLGGAGAGRSMLVSRSEPEFRLRVHVMPASEDEEGPHRIRLGALVLVEDPERRWRMDPDRVGTVLGLTPAESRVAVLFAQGKTIDTVAALTDRSRTTVKWHLRHIYAKLGLSRQAELMQLVSSVAHVVRAPD